MKIILLAIFCSCVSTCQMYDIKAGIYVGYDGGKAGVNIELDPVRGLKK